MKEVEVIYVPNGVVYTEKDADTSIEDFHTQNYSVNFKLPIGLQSLIGMNIEEHGQHIAPNKP